MSGKQCDKCRSFAINDDPEHALCDVCVREELVLKIVSKHNIKIKLPGWFRRMKGAIIKNENTNEWETIETAPDSAKQIGRRYPDRKNSILLCDSAGFVFVGRLRYGNLGEPQQDLYEWRCDSSGRYGNPSFWMQLPAPPSHA